VAFRRAQADEPDVRYLPSKAFTLQANPPCYPGESRSGLPSLRESWRPIPAEKSGRLNNFPANFALSHNQLTAVSLD